MNVLWLQEQCARKILPVTKVPGEDNVADLMTKHLGAAKIKKNAESMLDKATNKKKGKKKGKFATDASPGKTSGKAASGARPGMS